MIISSEVSHTAMIISLRCDVNRVSFSCLEFACSIFCHWWEHSTQYIRWLKNFVFFLYKTFSVQASRPPVAAEIWLGKSGFIMKHTLNILSYAMELHAQAFCIGPQILGCVGAYPRFCMGVNGPLNYPPSLLHGGKNKHLSILILYLPLPQNPCYQHLS